MITEPYVVTNKKYLAEALSYLGFRYYKFNDENGVHYSFRNTDNLQNALAELKAIKIKYDQFYQN